MPSLFNFSGQTPSTQQDVDAKRKMAQMLMQHAMQPNFGPNAAPLTALMPLAMMFAGNRAEKQAVAGEDKLKADRIAELQRIVAAGKGTPGDPGMTPLTPNDDEGNVNTVIPPKAAIPGGQQAMIDAMLGSKLPDMNAAGVKISAERMKPSDWKLGNIGAPGDKTQSIFYNPKDPSQYRPVGEATTKRDGVNINMGPEPVDPQAPWGNIRDPKKRDEAKMRYGMEAEKELSKAQEDVDKASNVNQALDRFLALNESNRTGGEYKVPGMQTVRGAFDPEFNEMASITDRLTPAMRQGMPGAASDRDVAMFRGATVGVDKPKESNKQIALGLKVANQNLIERQQFLRDYLTQKGHTRGAEAEWKKYLQANPIFDPSHPEGSYVLNENRLSYADWKSGGTPPGEGAVGGGALVKNSDGSYTYKKK